MPVVLFPGIDETKKISIARAKVRIIERYLFFSIHKTMEFSFIFYLYNFIL